MKIRLARTAGFCMGVRRAVDMVLDLRRESPPSPIITYGPLIHNPQTLQVLQSKGIQEARCLDEITGGTVVIRAHGISPSERKVLDDKGVKVIDATCPRVARVQAVIRRHAAKGHFCVIVGDEDHPEVRGLMGFASAGGATIPSAEEAMSSHEIPDGREVCVVAQTTQEWEVFQRVVDVLKNKFEKVHVYNTICDSTRKRQTEVSLLAQNADMIVVVGGKGSGNTRRLVQVAQAHGARALHVESEDEIPEDLLAGARVVGVTAGASTPNWQIRKVIDRLKEIGRSRKTGLLTGLRRMADIAVMTCIPAALGGAGLTAASLVLQSHAASWLPLAVTMLFVFSMHLTNRIQERSGAVRFNTPEIAAFYVRHRSLLSRLGAVTSAAALVLSYWMGLPALLLLAVMLVTGRLYAVQLVPEAWFPRAPWRSLKDVPGLKTPLVALGWATVSAVLPVIGSSEPLSYSSLAVTFIFSAGVVFWRTSLSDLLDIQGDRLVGRATIPILTGVKRTGTLLEVLLLGLSLLLIMSAAMGLIPPVGYGLVINIGIFGIFYLVYRSRHLVDRLLVEGILDGNLLLAGALCIVYGMT